MKDFKELGLCSELLQAIEEQGYEHPMPVQEEVIPWLLERNEDQGDLVALAQTGTGKTAAYGLPILQTSKSPLGQGPSALVLSPTRELCLQITDDLKGFAKYLPQKKILAVYGGANIEPQIRALKAGTDIVVATPGRLIDLMKRGAANLSEVSNIVLDEADEMLSMGFQEDIDNILEGIPEEHNTLLFSATMSREIEQISKKYLHDAHEIQVGSRNEGAENVNHIYYLVHAKDKYLALKRIVDYYPRIYAIVFCRTRMETQEVADNLIRDGYNADALHGELSQQQRDLTMQKFRQHRTQLLVATDVAARGLDVDDLTHVINYGMPDDVENYTHRSGRTGRAGKKGTSICIIHLRERSKIRLVEKQIKKDFVQETLPHPKDICTKQLYHVIDDIERVEVDEEEIAQFMPEVTKRWEWLDKEDLIKRIVSREFGRFLQYYASAPEIEEVNGKSQGKEHTDGKSGRKRKGDRNAEEGYARLFLNVGKIDGMYAREIINLINANVKGNKVEIGRIDLMKNFSFVEVIEADADRVMKAMKHGVTVKGRSVVVDLSQAQSPSTPIQKEKKKRSESDRDGSRTKSYGKSERSSDHAKRDKKKDKTNEGFSQKKRGFTDQKKGGRDKDIPQKKFGKEDWMQFFLPKGNKGNNDLIGEEPDFSEEGWARRIPKKSKKKK